MGGKGAGGQNISQIHKKCNILDDAILEIRQDSKHKKVAIAQFWVMVYHLAPYIELHTLFYMKISSHVCTQCIDTRRERFFLAYCDLDA